MKISIEKLESLLADESDRIDDLRLFSSVSPNVYALLYIASREGSIEIADAVFASRHCIKLLSFVINNVLTADDIVQVRSAIDHIDAQQSKSVTDYESATLLAMFIARQHAPRRLH
jgi:hypothetical protein